MKTIEEIKNTSLRKRTISEEYRLAKHEKRQPCCVYCGAPLQINQMEDVNFFWAWNKKTKSFVKSSGKGASYPPCCVNCEVEDWDFLQDA